MSVVDQQTLMVNSAVNALTSFVNHVVCRHFDPCRLARAVLAIDITGFPISPLLVEQTSTRLLITRQSDGGWSDPEETAWAIGCIRMALGQNDPAVQAGIQWLHSVRLPTGGWGRHPRDQARIPTTALIAALVPEAVKREDINWLQDEWARDFRGPVRLSYKAGFYLLAMPQGREDELVDQTIAHLGQDQNSDGGFAPWKGHPIGSEAWSTGVVLWGLSRWKERVDPAILERALNWLHKTQLPSGYWPYHYLDDGASLALIGSVAAMKALAAKE